MLRRIMFKQADEVEERVLGGLRPWLWFYAGLLLFICGGAILSLVLKS